MNAPTPPITQIAEAAKAVAGHNNPPAYDPEILSELDQRTVDFLKVTQEWIDLEKIENEQQAGLCTDQISGLRELYKEADGARKAAKKPHDDAGKEVQAAFNPILQKLKRAADAIKPKLEKYTIERQKAEAAAKAEQEEQARKEREAAEAAAKEAAEAGDINAQVEAEEQIKAATQAEKDAAKGPNTKVKSTTGSGRTMSMRKVKEVDITNMNVVYMYFKDEPKVAELLKALATAKVRSKDYDHATEPVPGIVIREVKKVA